MKLYAAERDVRLKANVARWSRCSLRRNVYEWNEILHSERNVSLDDAVHLSGAILLLEAWGPSVIILNITLEIRRTILIIPCSISLP